MRGSHISELLESIVKFQRIDKHRQSVIALAAANALPLLGVMLLGWKAFDVVFIYWAENVVIGIFNVAKILSCDPAPESLAHLKKRYLQQFQDASGGNSSRKIKAEERAMLEGLEAGDPTALRNSKLFLAPFFTVHYGMFCAVHLVFVCVLLSGEIDDGPVQPAIDAITQIGILLTIVGLVVSHGVSFVTNYLGKGEYRKTVPPLLMFQPYARVVILHVALLACGFLLVLLDSPTWMLFVFVVGKTVLDIKLHLREHAADESQESVTTESSVA